MDSWVPCLSRSRCRCRVQAQSAGAECRHAAVLKKLPVAHHRHQHQLQSALNEYIIPIMYGILTIIMISKISTSPPSSIDQPIPHLQLLFPRSVFPRSLALPQENLFVQSCWRLRCCTHRPGSRHPFPDRDGRETLTITHQSLIP